MLLFKISVDGEIFWTVVKNIDAKGTVTATVDNELDKNHKYKYGEDIKYNLNDVLDIMMNDKHNKST